MRQTEPRGQTMVLFALCMVLLAFMVSMTLAVGTKVKDRMELQTAADAAAYSNAVATARTMNMVSVLNRTQIAHTASVVGTISLLSWATQYYQEARAVQLLYLTLWLAFMASLWQCIPCLIVGPTFCPYFADCIGCEIGDSLSGVAWALIKSYADGLKGNLQNDINLFNNDTRKRWAAATQAHNDELNELVALQNRITGTGIQDYATQFAANGQLNTLNSTVVSANTPTSYASVGPYSPTQQYNLSEICKTNTASTCATLPGQSNAYYDDTLGPGWDPWIAGAMTQGTRGNPFVPTRNDTSGWGSTLAANSIPIDFVLIPGEQGSGYVNSNFMGSNDMGSNGHPNEAYAGDSATGNTHIIPLGALLVDALLCDATPFALTVFAWAWAIFDLIGVNAGSNEVSDGIHTGIDGNPHDFGALGGTIPPFLDFNAEALTDQDNIYGQPKNYAGLVRWYNAASPNVWELGTNDFLTGSASSFQMTQAGALTATAQGQMAIGTGVAYYRRSQQIGSPGSAIEEPPNLFAPYWHAGLTRMTVDRPLTAGGNQAQWDTNLQSLFTQGGMSMAEYGTLYNSLKSAGYRGFQ